MEEETETTEGGGGGWNDNEGEGRVIGGKRRGRLARGRSSRPGRHLGCHLRGRRRSRSGRPPWVRKKGKCKGCRTAGKPVQRFLWSGRQIGVSKAFRVAENLGGELRGVGGEVRLPRDTNTPGVKEIPRQEKTSGVTLEGNGVPGADGLGWGVDRNSLATQDTKGSDNTSRREEMASSKEPKAPHIPQWGTAEVNRGEESMQGHPDSADGDRTKHGALARRKYGLLAPEQPTGDPAAAEPQGSGYIPKDNMRTGGGNGREAGTEKRNRQRAFLTRGQSEDRE